MSSILDRVLAAARQLGASDVHLKVGLPPVFRIKGELRTVRDVPALSAETLQSFALGMMNDHQRETFEASWDVDLAYASPTGVRYRVNVFQQRGHIGLALRVIPPDAPGFETLNLPKAVLDLAERQRGLVLVTGITGAGKSTTLAALVDAVNARRACHIVTIEDPIEFVFRDRRSVVNQREIGFDTLSFSRALRAALRQDPDVIMVGEMRDVETTEIALLAAETGHLVLSTLHTADASDTVNRIVSMFSPHQQQQARLQLANVLAGIVSQRLMARSDGKGMIPAVELLVNTPRVKELLVDPRRGNELLEAIETGREPYGMVSFDQSLKDLMDRGLVTYEDALAQATRPDDFALYRRGVQRGEQTVTAGGAEAPAPELDLDDDDLAPGRFKR
ncbi:MAG TPA: PilT/PilU family type 4a pilus ATPase [Polyangia bacterium]|nr:PilT/PilU family type 4a pilus ATPase [Polyangia bacterium]